MYKYSLKMSVLYCFDILKNIVLKYYIIILFIIFFNNTFFDSYNIHI